MQVMKLTKKLVIAGATILAVATPVGLYAINNSVNSNAARPLTQSIEVVDDEKNKVQEIVEETAPVVTPEEVAPAVVEAEAPQAAAQTIPEEKQPSSLCLGTRDWIQTRYVEKKDWNGDPWYGPGPNIDAIIKDLQRDGVYSRYKMCVDAGEISAL